MAYCAMRFDLRNPPLAGTSMEERYRAALDMSEWADRLGFASVTLSEHHGSDDGYLPSPVAMAAAIAARTERIRIGIAALVASFHDPLRLAEDLAVVDLVSGGRLDVVITNGYVAREFATFGQPLSRRARRTAETVSTCVRLGAASRSSSAVGRPGSRRRRPSPAVPASSSAGAARRRPGGRHASPMASPRRRPTSGTSTATSWSAWADPTPAPMRAATPASSTSPPIPTTDGGRSALTPCTRPTPMASGWRTAAWAPRAATCR